RSVTAEHFQPHGLESSVIDGPPGFPLPDALVFDRAGPYRHDRARVGPARWVRCARVVQGRPAPKKLKTASRNTGFAVSIATCCCPGMTATRVLCSARSRRLIGPGAQVVSLPLSNRTGIFRSDHSSGLNG